MKVMTSQEIKEYRDSFQKRTARITSSKKTAICFLQKTGFYDSNGHLKKEFSPHK